ncbi:MULTISPECIES: type II toxin-antitoxin system RelE/ParE family toxin [unclassified Nitrospina]|uniref:type II toxin-antitoxin system RelE/ParE family toxin n=1 Tax=unclassified Nitrospina TaxID=2638683 RepID=UPI003F99487F
MTLESNIQEGEGFIEWCKSLKEGEIESIYSGIDQLKDKGSSLGFPVSRRVRNHENLRELFVRHTQEGGLIKNFIIFYAIENNESIVLLGGGDPTLDFRFYVRNVPEMLRQLKVFRENNNDTIS